MTLFDGTLSDYLSPVPVACILFWRETLTGGHSNFIRKTGAILHNVINGYGGLRISSGGLLHLRCGVLRIVLRALHFRGSRVTVGFDAEQPTLLVLESG